MQVRILPQAMSTALGVAVEDAAAVLAEVEPMGLGIVVEL